MREFKFHDAQGGAAITVKVTPRAKQNAITGVMGDGTIKISVTAQPVGGAANDALLALLSSRLGLPASQIDIIAGHGAPRKLISIVGLPPAEVEARLKPDEETKPKAEAKGKAAAKKKTGKKK